MPQRIVGVIPAAGYATRLQPLEGSKEVYRVGGRLLMDYVVERMRAARCDELRVVTRSDKRDVIEHAEELGARVIEGRPETLAQSIALGVEGLASKDVALIGLPDTIWDAEEGFARLVAALHDETDVALGLFTSAEPERSDVVSLDPSGLVSAVDVKPERPSSNLIWGCAAARVAALAGLEHREWPGEHFNELARAGRVRGVQLAGDFLDVGTKDALRRAEARFAE
jgi:NDP-sugar pyrophosphorylase family protein